MKCVSIWPTLEAALSILKVSLSVNFFYWEIIQTKETVFITESSFHKLPVLKKSDR
jgi:hypothetical protein